MMCDGPELEKRDDELWNDDEDEDEDEGEDEGEGEDMMVRSWEIEEE